MEQQLRPRGIWELGRLGAVMPDDIIRALRLAVRGKVISLAIPWGGDQPPPLWPDRDRPQHQMIKDARWYDGHPERVLPNGTKFSVDKIECNLHTGTHLDSLGHVWHDGTMFGGVEENTTIERLQYLGMDTVAQSGIVVEAVLLDFPRHLGIERLPPRYHVRLNDVIDCLDHQQVAIPSRGALIVRTGWLADPCAVPTEEPGITADQDILNWFRHSSIVLYGTDTLGNELAWDQHCLEYQSLHRHLVSDMGILFLEAVDVEHLAQYCEEVGQYRFCLMVNPLPIRGATGSPVNPLAIF